jgi:hypothetical protein
MFHEMDDNKDGLFDEMDDKDQDQNKQAEEETKDEEHNDDPSSSSSSTSINNVPTLSRSNSRLMTSNRSTTARPLPSKVTYNKTKKKPRMSILPCSLLPRLSFQDDNEGSGSGSWRQLIAQARIDEAKAKAAAASAQGDHAVLEREKWSYEKQEKTALANMTIQLEHMKKYTEMKQMGFSNEVIGEMVPELVPLINSIKRNS